MTPRMRRLNFEYFRPIVYTDDFRVSAAMFQEIVVDTASAKTGCRRSHQVV
jgi:hypothetical protein